MQIFGDIDHILECYKKHIYWRLWKKIFFFNMHFSWRLDQRRRTQKFGQDIHEILNVDFDAKAGLMLADQALCVREQFFFLIWRMHTGL